jgi:hypothetical protein
MPGWAPEALYLDRERKVVWTNLGSSGALSMIDLDTRTEIARLEPVCTCPVDTTRDAHGRLWVACFGSSEIVALDSESREAIARIGYRRLAQRPSGRGSRADTGTPMPLRCHRCRPMSLEIR